MGNTKMKNKKSGFTLVEVFVVLVIIGIIVMIVLAGKVIGPEYTTEIRNGHRYVIRESYEMGRVHVTMSHDPDCPYDVPSNLMPEKE